jgi:iron(II)-dependent oxidoreductase
MSVPEAYVIAECLTAFHDRLINQFSLFSEKTLRTQYHPDLSQLGWHLNHIAFIEQYWLREIVLGDDSLTIHLHKKYFPEMIRKTSRGQIAGLTDFNQLRTSFAESEELWMELSTGNYEHHLLKNNYLGWFLLQHGEQHRETMHLVLQQKVLAVEPELSIPVKPFTVQDPVQPDLLVRAGSYEIGSAGILACDNEQAVHVQQLPSFYISSAMVSNAEYLGFMQAGGYQRKAFWSDLGWLWKVNASHLAPGHWRQDEQNNWYSLSLDGAEEIKLNEAVSGLSWFEADAFARYAGARLPHEFEWEAAMKNDSVLFATTGQAWEWCANIFSPYEGFKAFPYERYSTPWFDEKHYTLRGGSPFSGECVRSSSFRNFYQPEKRHMFAGLRLVRDR